MSRQPSLWDTANVISLPGLGGGLTPYASPGGLMAKPSGPDPALANLSARQAGERGLLTSGTYGRTGFTSSGSAGLQSSLENRLRARLPLSGLTLFRMTWRVRVTPLGRLICALRASVRSTSGSDCGSWATPTSVDRVRDEATMEKCAAFRKRNANQNTVPIYLGEQAQLASWPTPQVDNFRSRGGDRKHEMGMDQIARSIAPWPTPMSAPTSEASHGQSSGQYRRKMAECAPWLTPDMHSGSGGRTSSDPLARKRPSGSKKQFSINEAAQISGPPANGSPAGTGSSGQLNPAFPLWLLGFPQEWDDCAPRVMPSRRK